MLTFYTVNSPLTSVSSCCRDGQRSSDLPEESSLPVASELCSRTFITFTDDKVFQDLFTQRKRKQPQKLTCPVTRLPAKYFDPITQTPYANAQAFKYIREAYAKQLEQEQGKADTPTQLRKREKTQPATTLTES